MSEYGTTLVQCPFYIENFSRKQAAEGDNRIRCEGVGRNNTLNLVFANKNEKHRYMDRYCCNIVSCQVCRIYKMLAEKYEVDDE